MSQNTRYQFWIIAAAAIIFFTYLGATSLFDEDETLYASCAREMMDRNDWVVPMLNGEMYPIKPPLMYWLMMVGFNLFGLNEFGARFPSAVLGVGTALLTYHLGRLMFNPRVGLWAGLITASSIIFTVSARAATADTALAFLTTLAVLCFVVAVSGQRTADSGQGTVGSGQWAVSNAKSQTVSVEHSSFKFHPSSFILHPFSYSLFVLLYISLGVSILSKGPVGFLLPIAAIGFFLMIVNSRRKIDESNELSAAAGWKAKSSSILRVFHPMIFLKSLWQLRPITGAIVVLAVSLPWHILVGLRTEGLWLTQFYTTWNFSAFLHPTLGHSGPVWYYIPLVLIGFFPWSVFLAPTTIDAVRRIRERDAWRDGYVLLSCLFGMFFIFWSICSTKLPHYLLPVYPALGLLTGCYLETWISQPARVGPIWMKNAWITTIAVGLCIIVAVGVAAWIYLPGEELIGMVGLILIAGGYLCLYYAKRQHRERAVAVFTCMAVIFLTAVFGFAAQRVDSHQNAKRLMARIRGDSRESAPVCAYRFFRQSMVYYAGQPVEHCITPEQLRQYIERTPNAYVITLDKYESEIKEKYPDQFRVLARERRFLATDDMVVLAPAALNDTSHTATRRGIGDRE